MKQVVVLPCSVYRGRSGRFGSVDGDAFVVECSPDAGGIGTCGGVGALPSASMVYTASNLVIMILFSGTAACVAVVKAMPIQVMMKRSVATFMVEGIGL